MRTPSELGWSALLLSCMGISALASTAITLALAQLNSPKRTESIEVLVEPPRAPKDEEQVESSEPPKTEQPTRALPVLDIQALSVVDVPENLRLEAFFSPQHMRSFDHSAIFTGCTNVFALIDAIHPYLLTFFSESSWLQSASESMRATILRASAKRDAHGRYVAESDDDDDDEDDRSAARRLQQWRLPTCIDPNEATEFVIYPGVDPRTFLPEKVINLDPNAPVRPPKSPHSAVARRYSNGRASSFVLDDPDHPEPQKKHIVVLPGALVLGGTFDVSEGSIHIGRNVRIEPNVYVKGPCIIGDHSTLRSGAYLRGDIIVGRHVVLRGEVKNALIMDHAELCHPGYCGDSVCGYKSHFGNQVTTANLNLFSNSGLQEIVVQSGNARYNTRRKKIGVILGDYAQLGCSSVTDPCTLIQRETVVYPLTRLPKGIYGPDVIIKNKPLERGVLEIVPIVRKEKESTEEKVESVMAFV
ncbi:hypothetical protein Poli38472_014347 [Pythium oligandrum]|uniref:Uncharacterized protein n=1 Tax=Pythium oligandrum TaxID=41045 RepID=A0A8K1C6Y4_PYTOL|nr:hypothetical protein Poli38472_014347 [Pythium oligandrum]|eukprot:TMW57744.1 hypothetical protein Poli38472_014347 [Pythium oligandrum]